MLLEVIVEYRSDEGNIPSQERLEWTQGFLSFHDQLWESVNKRNNRQSYQDGLFRYDIPTFNEQAVREAMLNAVSHRDYRRPGSVFVRQYPYRLTVVSPGGFPTGITLENILTRQEPANRRIAQALQRCGLIERAGQGMDLIFTTLIRESKPQPDFTDTDDYQVSITLRGEVQNPNFVRFLEKVGQERLRSFSTQDFLVLDAISRERKLTGELLERAALLRELGIVEKIGRKYMLSRDYYDFVGQRGVYTRKRGLDSETNRQLLLKHISDNAADGSPLSELQQVLPHLSEDSVQRLVRDLKQEGKIYKKGHTRGARWYPSP